jgi:hypothetical protein
MRMLEAFILGVPYLFLKKIPYAWLLAVVLWNWTPVVSGMLLAVVLLGLAMMAWQQRAWENKIMREFSDGSDNPYLDHPHVSRTFQIRNLLIVIAISGLLGWLMDGQIGRIELSGAQWFLLIAGFMLLIKDAVLFGAAVTIIITDQGVGIRYLPGYVDYRLFFKFFEIRQVALTKVPERFPRHWEVLTPQRHPKEGILLHTAKREGPSKLIRSEVLLAPTDMQQFLGKLAGHVAVTEEGSSASSD